MDPIILNGVINLLGQVIKTGPFGIVHKTHEVTIGGKKGLLVWDYILWNELTFE